MKFTTILAATLAIIPSALAVDQKKSVIVWYEDESTPDSTINSAKQSIIDAGGKITHVYELIRGFAAISPEKTLEQVQTSGSKYDVHIEDDEVVSIN
ncbi:hypothetical protein B0J13DRAFT_91445 [Dactylonectria estremocensis]|uniref:Inhibitor I9 domain-containing protein n=1 Tax=Dactylonectria estremocensis TaxID=1079267 RepID=A0A9P9ECB9_9HYPO|nr:hypothetical protein B0J13DRAFT_91445 [Dactylonectria estremocensis]